MTLSNPVLCKPVRHRVLAEDAVLEMNNGQDTFEDESDNFDVARAL